MPPSTPTAWIVFAAGAALVGPACSAPGAARADARAASDAAVPADDGRLAGDAGDGGVDAGDNGVDAGPPADYRPCATDATDPTGGFCDATARWGVDVGDIVRASAAATVADFDGDGRNDLFVTVFDERAPALLLNRGGRFENVAAAWGLSSVAYAVSSAAADLDGDGDPDLAVNEFGQATRVFRNDGDRFTQVASLGDEARHATAVLFADVDRDGLLDLLVAVLARPGECERVILSGCNGRVEAYRQTAPWSFAPAAVRAPARRVQALRMVDWDGDGRDEVLVVTDTGMFDGGNQVLRAAPGAGGAGFALEDATAGSGFDREIFGMGAGDIDVDGDGADEVLVTNFGRALLYRRDPLSGAWEDVARALLDRGAYGMAVAGPPPRYRFLDPEHAMEGPLGRFQDGYLEPALAEFPTTKWTPVVMDFDDDGADDAFVPSGAVGLPLYPEPEVQGAVMLRGAGGRLSDATDALGLRRRENAFSATAADLDGDGDLDLVVPHTGIEAPGRVRVLRNDAARGRAIEVLARGRGGARDGIGATVEVRVGARWRRRRLDGNSSVFASAPHSVRFGLGAAAGVDEIVVRFPSGAVVTRADVPAGRVIVAE